ncbi:hypothetical protein HY994_04020 [Candidatus Micrarchaeota archaeon]|nr:hypothetical protein [Candidatus Micrarchaeota archaeon]
MIPTTARMFEQSRDYTHEQGKHQAVELAHGAVMFHLAAGQEDEAKHAIRKFIKIVDKTPNTGAAKTLGSILAIALKTPKQWAAIQDGVAWLKRQPEFQKITHEGELDLRKILQGKSERGERERSRWAAAKAETAYRAREPAEKENPEQEEMRMLRAARAALEYMKVDPKHPDGMPLSYQDATRKETPWPTRHAGALQTEMIAFMGPGLMGTKASQKLNRSGKLVEDLEKNGYSYIEASNADIIIKASLSYFAQAAFLDKLHASLKLKMG